MLLFIHTENIINYILLSYTSDKDRTCDFTDTGNLQVRKLTSPYQRRPKASLYLIVLEIHLIPRALRNTLLSLMKPVSEEGF